MNSLSIPPSRMCTPHQICELHTECVFDTRQALVRFTREESLFPLIHSLPSGCASRTKDEQSIDFHHPGCVRRIRFASYILNVCLMRGKLWFASRARSLFPLIHSLPSGCASRTKDEQSIDFHHSGCVRRIGFASYILNVCSKRVHKPGCVRRIGFASYILVVYVSAASKRPAYRDSYRKIVIPMTTIQTFMIL